MVKNGYEKFKLEYDNKESVNFVLNVNIFFKLMIWWMNKIFVIGNKKLLEEDDLFLLLEEDKLFVFIEKL